MEIVLYDCLTHINRKRGITMWNCEVPNICVFMLCVGWYLLGIKLGREYKVESEDKQI